MTKTSDDPDISEFNYNIPNLMKKNNKFLKKTIYNI